MTLTRSQHPPLSEAGIRRYFEARFPDQRFTGKVEVQVCCPFHDDCNPSMSLNLQKAVAFCHAGCGGFGLLSFEKKFSNVDDGTAWCNIAEITGEQFAKRPEKIYVYEDEFGRPLFRVIRDPRDENGKKNFPQQKYLGGGKWAQKLLDARRVLYHLPEVITANEVLVVEGEKDCDNVRALNLAGDRADVHVAVTTNPGGAGTTKWLDAYSPYLAGKRVFVLPDNDEVGRAHAEQVAGSVSKFAAGVKVVSLPGLPEKGDVSDFLLQHSKEELIAELNAAKPWRPAKASISDGFAMFVDTVQFLTTTPKEVEWLVAGADGSRYRGVIQRGTGGCILGLPKAAKSLVALDLCICLALGIDWLDMFKVPRRAKCGIVSREDYPGMTRHRFERLFRNKKTANFDIEKYLYWNTRFQTPSFLLDRDEDLEMLITDLKRFECEFLLCDVFRRLHLGEENDATEMQLLMERITRVQNEVGCAIGLIHHTNKELEVSQLDSIFRYARGSSAIHGWMEWGLGIAVMNPEQPKREWVRRMVFENKAGGGPDSIQFRIAEAKAEWDEEPTWIRLEASPWSPPEKKPKGNKNGKGTLVSSLPYKEDD